MRLSAFGNLLAVLAVACAKPDGSPPRAHESVQTDAQAAQPDSSAALRREMVRTQIQARGVRDTAVLRAMLTVPRHRFVPEVPPDLAYTDQPLPLSDGQTISQPFLVAFMADAADINPGDRVLEIGTGSGYGAAVLAELAAEVYTIEIVARLTARAREALGRTGYGRVQVKTGDGWLGWAEHAPYDAIVVTAAPDRIPQPLIAQLAVDGVLVIPVGEQLQTLRVLRKTAGGLREEASLPVQFVPMVRSPPEPRR